MTSSTNARLSRTRSRPAHRRLVMAELRNSRSIPPHGGHHVSLLLSSQSSRYPGWGRLATRSLGSRAFSSTRSWRCVPPQSSVPDASGRRPPVTILGLADQQYLDSFSSGPRDAEAGRVAAAADPGSRVGPLARVGQADRAGHQATRRSAGCELPIARRIFMSIWRPVEKRATVS